MARVHQQFNQRQPLNFLVAAKPPLAFGALRPRPAEAPLPDSGGLGVDAVKA